MCETRQYSNTGGFISDSLSWWGGSMDYLEYSLWSKRERRNAHPKRCKSISDGIAKCGHRSNRTPFTSAFDSADCERGRGGEMVNFNIGKVLRARQQVLHHRLCQ